MLPELILQNEMAVALDEKDQDVEGLRPHLHRVPGPHETAFGRIQVESFEFEHRADAGVHGFSSSITRVTRLSEIAPRRHHFVTVRSGRERRCACSLE